MSRAREIADLGSPAESGLSNRNLIINGAMTVDQRNQTTTATNYTVDRFVIAKVNFDELVIAVTQDTDNPSGNGFSHSLKLAVTTAESAIAADELLYFDTRFEGQNIQHLCYGTSSAKSLTLSFWVKSPLTGKHAVNFYQPTPNRSNLQSYTVSSANTWEYKTITIDGDTSGNITNNNTVQLYLFWPLAGGSDYHGTPHTGWGAYTATDDFMFSDQVNLAGQTGNFFLTGVQLEIGDVATPFEHEDFGTTLAKCQRYFFRFQSDTAYDAFAPAYWLVTTQVYSMYEFPVTMRSEPSLTISATSDWRIHSNGGDGTLGSLIVNRATPNNMQTFSDQSGATGTTGHAGAIRNNNTASAYIEFSAEL